MKTDGIFFKEGEGLNALFEIILRNFRTQKNSKQKCYQECNKIDWNEIKIFYALKELWPLKRVFWWDFQRIIDHIICYEICFKELQITN